MPESNENVTGFLKESAGIVIGPEGANPGPFHREPGRDLVDPNLHVLVVGLGRFGGGVGVTRWLARQGAQVTVSDQADPSTLRESIQALGDLERVNLHLGGHDVDDLNRIDWVVINPAVVKDRSPFYQEIVRRNLPVTTELNLFCERCPAPVIGITGTYGKSTAASMLARVLESHHRGGASGSKVFLGGNIGRSLLADLESIRPHDLVILEMSNAQLEDLPRIDWAPTRAVITNLSPHHLDRYNGFEPYARAKLNIIGNAGQTKTVIAGPLDPRAETWLQQRIGSDRSRLIRVEEPQQHFPLLVPGRHNQRNAACVLAVARALGLPEHTTLGALADYPGLPHRLEYVRSIDGVDYYNDSKSTSPAALITSLEALDRVVVVIVGGQDKNADLTACASKLAQFARAVIGVGESGQAYLEAVRGVGSTDRRVPVRFARDLPQAVRDARGYAGKGDAVLFSPGAPSFDAYVNFEQRGRRFIECVHNLTPTGSSKPANRPQAV